MQRQTYGLCISQCDFSLFLTLYFPHGISFISMSQKIHGNHTDGIMQVIFSKVYTMYSDMSFSYHLCISICDLKKPWKTDHAPSKHLNFAYKVNKTLLLRLSCVTLFTFFTILLAVFIEHIYINSGALQKTCMADAFS